MAGFRFAPIPLGEQADRKRADFEIAGLEEGDGDNLLKGASGGALFRAWRVMTSKAPGFTCTRMALTPAATRATTRNSTCSPMVTVVAEADMATWLTSFARGDMVKGRKKRSRAACRGFIGRISCGA